MHGAQGAQVGQVSCQGLNVADHVAPQNGCQLVTVVLMVEPDLAIGRQGL